VTSRVAVCIVTYDSERCLRRCLEALEAQTRRPAHILVWDNASGDESAAVAKRHGADVVLASTNVGFARAVNELIPRTTTPYVLLLNPDAYLQPRYVELLEQAADADPGIGSVTGKLVRSTRHGNLPVLDSTGHVLYRNRVAANRGENEPDRGQHDTAGEVFGVCAAAALYRRAMLEDVRLGPEYFDSRFFLYLEDVDLDWRARLRGWKAWYVPAAVAEHERGHQGDRRRQSAVQLRHSIKNSYLMMIRNDRPADILSDVGVLLVSEILRFLDYALSQPTALLGYVSTLHLLRHAYVTRRQIQRRRVVDGAALGRWREPYPFAREFRRRLTRTLAIRRMA
jgi:GT2 family glycosyltransferase